MPKYVYIYICTSVAYIVYLLHRTNDSIESVPQIASWFSRMHAVLIGPGLGRGKECLETAKVGQPVQVLLANHGSAIFSLSSLFILVTHRV